MHPPEKSYDYGFEKVSADEKTSKVTNVFERVASRYDLMNDVMSLGIHRLWKHRFVNSLPMIEKGTYLDVAGGTGDIAEGITGRLKKFNMTASQIIADINPAMIEEGKSKRPHFSWLCASAEALPLADNSVDVYTIAFGLRNVTHKEAALEEAYRVLRPGGKFSCLEFSQVLPPLQKFYDLYSFHLIPRFGEWIAKDKEAYQYLVESIRTFYMREELISELKTIGFQHVKAETYSAGVTALHTGYKV